MGGAEWRERERKKEDVKGCGACYVYLGVIMRLDEKKVVNFGQKARAHTLTYTVSLTFGL